MKINWIILKEKLYKNILKLIGIIIAIIALILYICKVDFDVIVTILAVGGVIIMIDMKVNKI